MGSVNLKSLVSKLNDTCRRSLEAAAGLCLSRTHYNVEVEHWLLKLVEAPDTDIAALLRHFEISVPKLTEDLNTAIDRFKTGNARPPALSQNVVTLAREARLIGDVDFGSATTRSGHVLAALLNDESMALLASEASDEFDKISLDVLKKDLPDVTEKTAEAAHSPAAASSGGKATAGTGTVGGKTPSLDQFTVDLTAKAKAGKIDPVLGRDSEVRQVVDILTRRRQNNPILTGEAGVGKTAVVEGLAQRIADGDVPPPLRGVSLRTLDLGLLQAGAGVKGEFENRLKSVIDEVKASVSPVILFIDEAHTMIGAGGTAGQGDAANLLKPALARGELRTIAATTWAEYKKYFEKDAALARRFQVVKVEEPSEEVACQMVRGLVPTLEKHHSVRILNEAVVESVRLSHRYVTGRQLPDKSVSLLDTACARVRLSQSATPADVEDCRRRIEAFTNSINVLKRETATGTDHSEKLGELESNRSAAEAEFTKLETRWKAENVLVEKLQDVYQKLGFGVKPPESKDSKAKDEKSAKPAKEEPAPDPAALKVELAKLEKELKALQGEMPLVNVCVDGQAVAAIVSSWTGIPVGRMVSDEIQTVMALKDRLEERVIGQDHSLAQIAERIRMSRANLTDPSRPIGVFLLVGTSGVGKTETALALADLLYGGEQNMTVINMTEFKEEHKVSLLMGSPPGYVGYGEGGILTEAVRRRPYSVVLLDEMEKAHTGLQDVFFQVFDKGIMRDGEGRDINFKNTVIIMTSNACTDLITKLCADPETRPDAAGLAEALHPELLKTFKPAFLGRVTVVPYFPLADDIMQKIVKLQLNRIGKRVRENYRASFSYTPELVAHIAGRCKEVSSGARNVDHIITRSLLPALSTEFLSRMGDGIPIKSVNIGIDAQGSFSYDLA